MLCPWFICKLVKYLLALDYSIVSLSSPWIGFEHLQVPFPTPRYQQSLPIFIPVFRVPYLSEIMFSLDEKAHDVTKTLTESETHSWIPLCQSFEDSM